jgi:hypothetical protein
MADESMAKWMEYLYMQKPKPTDATGVQVHLTAIDPNGNFQDLGMATTDMNGRYALAWTPPVEGTYHLTATFESTDSYWGSSDTGYFTVSLAPSPSVTPIVPTTTTPAPSTPGTTSTPVVSPSPAPDTGQVQSSQMYLIALSASVIIVIIAVAAMIFRRRK